MRYLALTIEEDTVEKDCLAIYWISQAGFVFKTPAGKIIYVDPYFSDLVERVAGFKRMMPCPIAPEEAVADIVACTHEHPDHLDTDALPILAKNPRTHFAGPAECVKEFRKWGIPDDRYHLLEEGKEISMKGIGLRGVYADHGELAPDAIGILLDLEGIKVYHTGDTAYRSERFQPVMRMKPHVLIPCINGRFGNMNAEEAALLTRDTSPRLAIGSHFWMFVEHNGNPAEFLDRCSEIAPGVPVRIMQPGERILFRK